MPHAHENINKHHEEYHSRRRLNQNSCASLLKLIENWLVAYRWGAYHVMKRPRCISARTQHTSMSYYLYRTTLWLLIFICNVQPACVIYVLHLPNCVGMLHAFSDWWEIVLRPLNTPPLTQGGNSALCERSCIYVYVHATSWITTPTLTEYLTYIMAIYNLGQFRPHFINRQETVLSIVENPAAHTNPFGLSEKCQFGYIQANTPKFRLVIV